MQFDTAWQLVLQGSGGQPSREFDGICCADALVLITDDNPHRASSKFVRMIGHTQLRNQGVPFLSTKLPQRRQIGHRSEPGGAPDATIVCREMVRQESATRSATDRNMFRVSSARLDQVVQYVRQTRV